MNELQLITVSGHNEPLVVDTDLGERLGYAQPRFIRRLIKSLSKNQEFGQITMRAATARIAKSGAAGVGGVEEREVKEYLLTERQALLVVSSSDTPRAFQLKAMIVDVFMAWRRGQLVPANNGAISVDVLNQMKSLMSIAEKALAIIPGLEARLTQIESHSSGSSAISKPEHNAIKRAINEVAELFVHAKLFPTKRAARSHVTWNVYSCVNWVQTGCRQNLLPRHLISKAWSRLEEMKREGLRALGPVEKNKQLSFGGE